MVSTAAPKICVFLAENRHLTTKNGKDFLQIPSEPKPPVLKSDYSSIADDNALVLKHPHFFLSSSSKPADAAITVHHAMAWHDRSVRVVVECVADSTIRFALKMLRDILVRRDRAFRYSFRCLPDELLKGCHGRPH